MAATAVAALIVAASAAHSQTATDTQGGDRKATGQQTQGPEPKKAKTTQGRTAAPVADKKTGTDGANRVTTEKPQGPEPKKAQTTQGRTSAPVADKKTGTDNKAQTTQGRTSAPVADKKAGTDAASRSSAEAPKELSSEQRSQISSTFRSQSNLHRVDRNRISFSVNVGTVVPRSFNLVPLPAPIYSVVPAYRGYLYVVVGDDLLIIHPRTHRIVAVLPA